MRQNIVDSSMASFGTTIVGEVKIVTIVSLKYSIHF